MTETEILRIRFLDWLFDTEPHNGTMAETSDFLGDETDRPEEQDRLRGVVRQLRDEDMIMLAESMGSSAGVLLTGRGRAEVEKIRARRADVAQRSIATRNGFIRWLYEQPGHKAHDVSAFFLSALAYYEGVLLTSTDIDNATSYLLAKNLIKGVDVAEFVIVDPELTDNGIDCVEQYGASVADFLKRDDGKGSQHVVNFNAPVSGAVAWDSHNFTQTVHAGIDGTELATVVKGIVEAIPLLGLSEPDVTSLREVAKQAQDELNSATPDVTWIKSLLERTRTLLGKAAATALATSLEVGIRLAMEKVGLSSDG